MKRIEELLEKYWKAETSLAEEHELKNLISRAEGYEEEKEMFSGLAGLASEEPENLITPQVKVRKLNSAWLNWAASIAILAGSFYGWKVYEQKQEEEEAYGQVMMAFDLIQTNLSKGQEKMEVMTDLKYLNTANQLFETIQTK
jgi:hypothetical protein